MNEPLTNWHERHESMWAEVLLPIIESQNDEPLRILEIGSWAGHATAWIARELLGNPDSRLHCVDPWDTDETIPRLAHLVERARAEWLDRVWESGKKDQILELRGTSAEFLPKLMPWSGEFDLIYIDGSHEAPDVLFDSTIAMELLKVGGIIIWDDYKWNGGSGVHAPAWAIDAVLHIYAERLRVLHKMVQVVAVKTEPTDPREQPVSVLSVGHVARSGMRKAGIKTVGDLADASASELAAGAFRDRHHSLNDLKISLRVHGLRMRA